MESIIHSCNIQYNMFHQDEGNYTGKWQPMPSNTSGLELKKVDKAFQYQSAFDLVGLPYWGLFGTYSGGGFVADLGTTESQARNMVAQLKENHWVDLYTRAVSLEFTTYNPNINLFSYVLYMLEFPTTGGSHPTPRISSVQVSDLALIIHQLWI